MTLTEWWSSSRERIAHLLPQSNQVKVILTEVPQSRFGVHLAVMSEPFLSFVLAGTKTVESRFSNKRIPPYQCALSNDIILLKEVGGPVVATCLISQTWYFDHPTRDQMVELKEHFGKLLRDDVPGFWDRRIDSSYISLLEVEHVSLLSQPISCPKKDRRGWVTIRGRE